MGYLPDFKKVYGENFDSMILSFATKTTKRGFNIDKYEIIIQPPSTSDPFYQITFNAYKNHQIVHNSEGGLIEFLKKERDIAEKYNIPLEVKASFLKP